MRSAEIDRAPAAPASDADAREGAYPEIGDGHDERLVWTLLRTFEPVGIEHYRAHAPDLATPEKVRFVAELIAQEQGAKPGREGDAAALASSPFAAPVARLLARSENHTEASTRIVQGLVLEMLGQAIYAVVERTSRMSEGSRAFATIGLSASRSVTAALTRSIGERIGTGEPLYAVFADLSYDALGALDGLAEPVDGIFGPAFGIRFADLMGEFTAELVATCTALGMQRRKVVAQLAGACMGI